MQHRFCLSISSEPSPQDEHLPQGYKKALEVHKALSVNLLSQAINGESISRCWDYVSWVGRCLKGERNRIATDYACSIFELRKKLAEKSGEKPKCQAVSTPLEGFSLQLEKRPEKEKNTKVRLGF